MLRSFERFAEGQDRSEWRFWDFRIPDHKAEPGRLQEELRRFNARINNEFSVLRKLGAMEVFLFTIHLRYDWNTALFDLHAHLICRVPDARLDEVDGRFFRRFSAAYTPYRPVQNPAAATTYSLWGVLDHAEFVTWPAEAFEAAWDLSQSKARLVRTGGSFAAHRRAEKEQQADPAATAERARRRRNRAQTAYDGPRKALGQRVLGTADVMLQGHRTSPGQRRGAWKGRGRQAGTRNPGPPANLKSPRKY